MGAEEVGQGEGHSLKHNSQCRIQCIQILKASVHNSRFNEDTDRVFLSNLYNEDRIILSNPILEAQSKGFHRKRVSLFFPFLILVECIGEAKEYQTNFEAGPNRSNYQVVPHRSQSKSVSRSPSGSDSGTAKSRSGSRSRSPSGELLAWLVKKS